MQIVILKMTWSANQISNGEMANQTFVDHFVFVIRISLSNANGHLAFWKY